MDSPLSNSTYRRLFTAQVVALMGTGLSSIALALLLPRWLDTHPDRPFMLAGGVLLGAGLLAGLAEPAFLALLPIWFVLGAGSSLVRTPADRLLRHSAHEGDRPAIYAAQFALSHACWLFAYPLAGSLNTGLGLTVTFVALALVALASTGVAAALWPSADDVDLEHVHEEMEHLHLHVHDEHHLHEHEGWEGPEPHAHPHRPAPLRHRHPFVIDLHHPVCITTPQNRVKATSRFPHPPGAEAPWHCAVPGTRSRGGAWPSSHGRTACPSRA